MKSSWDRTPKDLVLIQNLIMRIKAFETYSLALKAELARVLLYQKFGKGRVVIQQGVVSVKFKLEMKFINFITELVPLFYKHSCQRSERFMPVGKWGKRLCRNKPFWGMTTLRTFLE